MAGPSGATDARATALNAFNQARDAFLAVFAQAPDDALSFVPAGDEYALGVLPIHLQDSMQHYLHVLDEMQACNFGAVDISSDAQADAEHHAHLAAKRPTGAQRQQILDDLAHAHRAVQTHMIALEVAQFAREAPVIYSAGTQPYPTSGQAIMGWLVDHYHEHVAQTQALLAQWQAER